MSGYLSEILRNGVGVPRTFMSNFTATMHLQKWVLSEGGINTGISGLILKPARLSAIFFV